MKKNLATSLLGAALLACGSTGCECYRNFVDPSYPERYEHESRQTVAGPLTTQVENGHVLDQTIWNAYFDPATDRLTAAGIRELQYIGRRRPTADTVVYLQQANDIAIDPDKPDVMAETRNKLDLARAEAVHRFMVAQTGLDFQVVMPHNPAVPYLSGQEAITIQQNINGSARGTLSAPGGSPAGGAVPPAAEPQARAAAQAEAASVD